MTPIGRSLNSHHEKQRPLYHLMTLAGKEGHGASQSLREAKTRGALASVLMTVATVCYFSKVSEIGQE